MDTGYGYTDTKILDIGYMDTGIVVTVYWIQDTGYWILNTGYTDTRIPGYRILVTDTGKWIQDTRYRI